jgi:hypothetical protein
MFGCAMALATSALGTTFTFSFDSVANNATNSTIQSYMQTIIPTATISGARASRTYNGDGHVIGPTLGPDTFIMNDGPSHDSFTIGFGSNFYISSISFDWEIFPDASCSGQSNACRIAGTTNVNWPDFDVYADGSSTAAFHALGVDTANYSPQAIGYGVTINLAGAHTLSFVDWPAEIAIDNLVINGCVSTAANVPCLLRQTPEPSSLLLGALALGVLGLGLRQRKTGSANV